MILKLLIYAAIAVVEAAFIYLLIEFGIDEIAEQQQAKERERERDRE